MKKILSLIVVLGFMAWGTIAWAAAGDPLLEPLTIDQIESTDKSGSDGTLITGTAGTSTYAAVWNADGDLIDGPGVPAVVGLTNLASVAINESLVSDAANTDDLGTDANYWKKLFLASEIQFEGATDDGVKTTISVTDPTTSSKTITIPNSDETIGVATSAATDAIDTITEIASGLKSGSDGTLITGTAGTSGNVAVWNADGDIVDGGAPGTPGSFPQGDVTIDAAGLATIGTDNWIHLTGNGDAADDLVEIAASALGDIIVLQLETGKAYTVTVKDGTYMNLQNNADFLLDDPLDTIIGIITGLGANDTFTEISRASNG